MRTLVALIASITFVAMSGCSYVEQRKVEYKSAGSNKAPSLEVPPDLTRPGRDDRYLVPESPTVGGGTTTLSTYQADRTGAPRPGTTEVLPSADKVKIQRSGNQRWLLVAEPPEKVWPVVRDFWVANGFVLRTEQPDAGVMETDWAENRARIPDDGIRSILARALDSVYSTGERDKFRTRLERGPTQASTEIFISHRGMSERSVVRPGGSDSTIWEPRQADPELEAVFLQRLHARFSADEARAKSDVASSSARQPLIERAKLVTAPNSPGSLELDEPFDRAWRRVGLALDRVGFTVEDRDRTKGYYFVRYLDLREDEPVKKDGILSRFAFWRTDPKPSPGEQFRVLVKGGSTESSEVRVLNKDGGADPSSTAKRILSLLHEQLR